MRKYFIISIPFDIEEENKTIFILSNKYQRLILSSNAYYTENKLDFLTLEKFPFIFLVKAITSKKSSGILPKH